MNETDNSRPLPQEDPASDTTVSFESIPMLAADADFITKFDRLRELKQLYDRHFAESKTGAKDSEFDILKLELGARAMVAGVKSVSYQDLRLTNADGGVTKGKVNGQSLADALTISNASVELLREVVAAAKDFDVQALVDAGVSPMTVANAKDPDKPRAASMRVEWIGGKGKGANQRRGGGPVQ